MLRPGGCTRPEDRVQDCSRPWSASTPSPRRLQDKGGRPGVLGTTGRSVVREFVRRDADLGRKASAVNGFQVRGLIAPHSKVQLGLGM